MLCLHQYLCNLYLTAAAINLAPHPAVKSNTLFELYFLYIAAAAGRIVLIVAHCIEIALCSEIVIHQGQHFCYQYRIAVIF